MQSALILAVAATAYLAAPIAAAATYKWVDEQGVVHYTDKMPPEAVNRGTVELTKQGVQVRKVDPAMTPEQRRAREQEEERKRNTSRQQEETSRRDSALLASYASEAEIELARNRAFNTIDSMIASAQSYSQELMRRKADIDKRLAPFNGKQPPAVLERENETVTTELARQSELINTKRAERAAVGSRYDAEKMRWRELAARAAGDQGSVASNVAAPPTPTAAPASAAPAAPVRK
jgi:hypothetical protein